MSIPLYILTGFLGSGKTTFLKRVLDQYANGQKIGIIQNEFAPLNVDAVELKQSDTSFELMQVNRGSVFCVCLVADFKTGLRDFVNAHKPDAVFLEASGLSDPIAVVEILQAPELQDCVHLVKIWSIVDASSFLIMEKSNLRITHQVRVADVVIINKMDKADAEAIRKVEERINQINPLAKIFQTSYCDVDIHLADEIVPPVAIREQNVLDVQNAQPRPVIGTAVVKSTKKISRPALDQFLHEYSAKAYRLKGHVQLDDGTALMVQITNGDCQLSVIQNYIGPTELVAIGPDVDPREFSTRFRELI
jgi:G3E family GTPase